MEYCTDTYIHIPYPLRKGTYIYSEYITCGESHSNFSPNPHTKSYLWEVCVCITVRYAQFVYLLKYEALNTYTHISHICGPHNSVLDSEHRTQKAHTCTTDLCCSQKCRQNFKCFRFPYVFVLGKVFIVFSFHFIFRQL